MDLHKPFQMQLRIMYNTRMNDTRNVNVLPEEKVRLTQDQRNLLNCK